MILSSLLNEFRFVRRLRFERELERMRRDYHRPAVSVQNSAAPVSPEERRKQMDDDRYHWEMYNEERYRLVTSFWTSEADRLFVPTPDFADERMWERTQISGFLVLTRAGADTLEMAVELKLQRRSERRERWMLLLTGLVTAAAGLVGALIGYASINSQP